MSTRLSSSPIFRRHPYTSRNYVTTSRPDPIESDVVIVGGGVAGLALASALGGFYLSLNS